MNYRTQIFGNAAFTFHLAKDLDLKTQIGVDNHNNTYRGYSSIGLNNISMPNGWAEINHTNTLYWQEETYLTHNLTSGKHRLNTMAGLSWQERVYNYLTNQEQKDSLTTSTNGITWVLVQLPTLLHQIGTVGP